MSVSCKLFGYPTVIENDIEVSMPSGKVSAVFYYVLMKKTVSRDELANVFWSEAGEKNAKISLRNALHKIKKIFKEDIILTPNKSVLTLNENINFDIDVKKFEANPSDNLDLYTEDFLKGFYIKNAVDFEYWSSELSSFYKELFMKTSEQKIIDFFEKEELKECKKVIYRVLNIDNFNEVLYLYLMKIYKLDNRYDKIINEYYNLKKLMNEELGIDPSKEIEDLYNEALNIVKRNQNKEEKRKEGEFFSRTFEYEKMSEEIDNFFKWKPSKSILINGETGVGKTFLKNKIVEGNKDRFLFYEVPCYSIEKNFSFLSWIKIIKLMEKDFLNSNLERPPLWEKIVKNLFFDSVNNIQPTVDIVENKENFIPNLIYDSMYNAFDILGNNKKVVIVFEDIQWMDELSMKLLISLILSSNKNILFIVTKSNESDKKIDELLFTLKDLEKLTLVDLKPFDRTEVDMILKKTLGKKITEEEIENIFEKSKGNSFFLREYIELFKKGEKNKVTSSKMNSILKDKISNLSNQEIDILRVISVFYGDVTLNILLKILDVKAFEMLKSLDNLKRLNILSEKKEVDEVIIEFVYSAYKNMIYDELSSMSKQIINKEIIRVLESEVFSSKKDITIYNRLKYHYNQANQEVGALKYDVHILNYYLNFNHEIYPNLCDYNLSKGINLFISNEKVLKWIEKIEKKIFSIKNSERNKNEIDNMKKIEILFLYCKGRYLIRVGRYLEGSKIVNKVIALSKEIKDTDIELRGYKQIIIYGIQINNPNMILKNIIKGIKLTKKIENTVELGVFYRFYGLYNLMIGKFETAEALFEKSISFFSKLEDTEKENSISIAANYNYIGEIRKAEGKNEEALKYFQKAIELSKNKEVACLSIFYINIAKLYCLTNDFQNMRKNLLVAEKIVKKFDLHWRVPVLDSYLALLLFFEGDYLKSVKYLKSALSEAKVINNLRDSGIIYFVESIIASNIKNIVKNTREIRELKEFLTEEVEVYSYNAFKCLDSKRDKAEIEYLKNLK